MPSATVVMVPSATVAVVPSVTGALLPSVTGVNWPSATGATLPCASGAALPCASGAALPSACGQLRLRLRRQKRIADVGEHFVHACGHARSGRNERKRNQAAQQSVLDQILTLFASPQEGKSRQELKKCASHLRFLLSRFRKSCRAEPMN